MASKKHSLPDFAPLIFGADFNNRRLLQVRDGNGIYSARFLGRGRFNTVFQVDGTGMLLIYSFYGDKSKSILAQAYKKYQSPYLPSIAKVGTINLKPGEMSECRDHGQNVSVYKTLYYNKVLMKHVSDKTKKVINDLQEAHNSATMDFPFDITLSLDMVHKFNERLIYYVEEQGHKNVARVLHLLKDAATDWGDHYGFDSFRPRNLGLRSNGHIVFIDPMFDMYKIKRDAEYRAKSR